ncbi:hypothetical protein B0H15DRAFT_940396 [Mycena belliarum]|uniref:PARP catalytic domain-containing protein n=1 Tax=Mycena belliarum TaxID=1033014 RepID=A0AAD6XIW0_9AGAR|nr:hypothetical protein B0H15DRAFT_940396 [Mycena belliae]
MPSILQWATRHKAQTPVQTDLCEVKWSGYWWWAQCGLKPKFVEPGGSRHPYCSRSCAKQAQGPSPSACALRGCRATGKPAFSNFCSDDHGRQAVRQGQVEGCESCHEYPRASGDVCIACDRKSTGPRLREVSIGGTTFKTVRAQFLSEWDGPSAAPPKVEKVYQISVPRDVRVRHDAYRANQRATEEVRTFHSSQCICDLGTKAPTSCDFKSCGICRIVKSSFHELAFGETYNNGRFGEGIYSYRNPSLADVHATSATSTPYRVTIACDVSVEASFEIPDEQSVFVPSADAIVPAYIIMYTV